MAGRARAVVVLAALCSGLIAAFVPFAGALAQSDGPAAGRASAAAPEGEDLSTALVERARGEAGLSEYRVATDLIAVARRQAETMAREDRLHHNPHLSSDVEGWESVGENVGVGMSVDDIHRAFMESQTHRDEILSGTFTEVGIGVVSRDDGTYWVAQVFRKPMPPAAPVAARGAGAGATRPATAQGSDRGRHAASATPVPDATGVAGVASSGVGAGVGGSAAAPPTAELGPDLDALGAALSASRVVPQLVFADGSTRTSGLERPGARGWAGGGEVTGPIAIAASMLLLVVIGLMVQVGGSASHAPRRIGVMRAALA